MAGGACAAMMSVSCWLFGMMVVGCYGEMTRNLSVIVNPDCKVNTSCMSSTQNFSLVYVRAPLTNATHQHYDEMNYLWSTIAHPSIVASHTKVNESITVDWNEDDANPINKITLKSTFSQAIIVSKIFTFNLTKLNLSDAEFNKTNNNVTFSIDLTNIKWEEYNKTSGVFNGSYHMPALAENGSHVNGTVYLAMKCFAATKDGSQGDFPHLPFSANTTLVELQLYLDVPFTREQDSSVGLELIVVPDPTMRDRNVDIQTKRTLDDEYTPSIFYSYTMEVGGSDGGFLQWKPIIYTSEKSKTVENSEQMYVQPKVDGRSYMKPFMEKALPNSTVDPLYGSQIRNVSVFYVVYHPSKAAITNPTFFSWTITMGYGEPPTQGFSAIVILTISLGLGIPAGVTVLGSIYVVYKKWQLSKKTSGYISVN